MEKEKIKVEDIPASVRINFVQSKVMSDLIVDIAKEFKLDKDEVILFSAKRFGVLMDTTASLLDSGFYNNELMSAYETTKGHKFH